MKRIFSYSLLAFWFVFSFLGCKENYTPKPRGYFRIDFPEKNYQLFNENYPFEFEYPVYSKIIPDTAAGTGPYWLDIYVPANNAKVHLTYKSVKKDLSKLTEDSRELAYKHTIKASSIDEKLFINPSLKVYGTVYYIKGNAASPMQFYITDSINHFLRGSLYISEVPNYDSLMPVISFLESDIVHIIESLHWK